MFQLVIQTAFEIERNHARVEGILNTWRGSNQLAVELGQKLWDEQFFNQDNNIEYIFDSVIRQYEAMVQS